MPCHARSRKASRRDSSPTSPSRSKSKSSWRRWTPHWNPCPHMPDASAILKAKVLIVDDLPANVLLLERMLGGAGYDSITSTLDPRAVHELHEKNRYDLIVLDLQMRSEERRVGKECRSR